MKVVFALGHCSMVPIEATVRTPRFVAPILLWWGAMFAVQLRVNDASCSDEHH
jgi:hypothetical protein